MGIAGPEELRDKILSICRHIDFEAMVEEVQAFLFDAKDAKRLRLFEDYFKQVPL